MPSDSGETTRRPPLAPPADQEQLPCPRCASPNTKFCYYNNYNYSQPRHFCKACRRYWTHGGTLRDIPVGGGTRKSAKRSRTTTQNITLPATPLFLPVAGALQGGGGGEMKGSVNGLCGGFTSLLSNNSQGPGGFLALNGFGLGLGSDHDEVGFGLGRAVWPFNGGAGAGGVMGGAGTTLRGNTWQFESGGDNNNNGFILGGDCYSS